MSRPCFAPFLFNLIYYCCVPVKMLGSYSSDSGILYHTILLSVGWAEGEIYRLLEATVINIIDNIMVEIP